MGAIYMADYDQICAQVLDVLKPHAKSGQTLSDETELVGDLGLDSVQVMEILLQVEEHFDISVPLNILPEIRSVKDLCVQLQQIVVKSS